MFTSPSRYANGRTMQRFVVIVRQQTMTYSGGPVEGVLR